MSMIFSFQFIKNQRVLTLLSIAAYLFLFHFILLDTVFAMYDENTPIQNLKKDNYEEGRVIVRYKDDQSPYELESISANLYILNTKKLDSLLFKFSDNFNVKSGLYFYGNKSYDLKSQDKLSILHEIVEQKIIKIQNALNILNVSEEKFTKLDALGLYYYDYSFSKKDDVKTKIAKISQMEEVEYAEPKYIYEIQKTPNDPSFQRLWGLSKTQAENAWDKSIGSKDILIAVSDGELDKTHPDLAANISEIKMLYPCSNPSVFHGTHVSGTIGAIGDNNEGVVGVNWQTKILFINIGCGRKIDPGSGAESIDYAVSKGARVLNMSWGGTYSKLVAESIKNAKEKGLIMVVASGNSEMESPGCADTMYPASDPNVITVAAVNQSDEKTNFSCTGRSVDIAAPGQNILSTVGNGSYGSMNGTSMAAPHVTGLVGLILSVKPDMNFDSVKALLAESADKIGNGDEKKFGAGRINIGNAIAKIAGSNTPPPGAINPTSTETKLKSGNAVGVCGDSNLFKKFEFVCSDGRKGTIVPENDDECGEEATMRAEAEKACASPSQVTLSPDPTGSTITSTIAPTRTSGEINIHFKVKLQGVTGTPRVSEIKAKVGMKEPSFEDTIFQDTTLKYLGSGIWEGGVFLNLKPRGDYTFLIKGPFHMQRKFCETSPKELYKGIYQCVDGKLALGLESVEWDFSTIPLLVGDLPDLDGTQDGIVNARDIAQLRQSIDRNDPEILDFCDVNFDGACNTTDYSLLIAAISARADEN